MRRGDSTVNMTEALEKSLDMLGEPSKKALLFHFNHSFRIHLGRKDCSLDEIEGALKQILGEGAALVVASITSQLGQETK